MYLTEDQAKEKWCPMALAPLRDHPEGMFNIAVNREWEWTDGESPQSSANCIGSTCMMWRQTTEFLEVDQKEPVGYCGLAAKPC